MFSIRKIPHNTGINNSFLKIIAKTAITPPNIKLPVSPIKTCAGYVLYQKNPITAPTIATAKMVVSPIFGRNMILR